MKNNEYYMREALKEAVKAFESDEVPVGAIITHKGEIIGRAHNQIKTLKDPTAHAEIIAITQAANFLQSERLIDCVMYSTLEPCSMCAGAMVLSRLENLVYAAKDPKTGAHDSVFSILNNKKLNHRVKVKSGILKQEASSLIKEFFHAKRLRRGLTLRMGGGINPLGFHQESRERFKTVPYNAGFQSNISQAKACGYRL